LLSPVCDGSEHSTGDRPLVRQWHLVLGAVGIKDHDVVGVVLEPSARRRHIVGDDEVGPLGCQLGCGILDLNFEPVSRDKTLRAIELFGTRVLPRLRDL
jgi:hypothetical protein